MNVFRQNYVADNFGGRLEESKSNFKAVDFIGKANLLRFSDKSDTTSGISDK
jgi:hypothetical protein